MQLGLAYLYTISKFGYPPSIENGFLAMKDAAQMGYKNIELEGLFKDHLIEVHARRKEFQTRMKDLGLRCYNFCPVLPEMIDPSPAVRKKAAKIFALGVETAAYFGADTVHIATFAPKLEFIGGRPYNQGGYSFKKHYRVRVDPKFKWEPFWKITVEAARTSADLARQAGLDVIVEPRVGETIAGTDSLLRLMDHVERDNLKANFDFAHMHAQLEILPLSVEKLAGKIGGVHVADNDGASTAHLALGHGTIDFEGTFKALMKNKYDGVLGIDLGLLPDMAQQCRNAIGFMHKLAKRVGFTLD
ncbi:MAG: sugar phosphate isomerase/epimerase family protein [Planctomycetota bacterium]